MIEWDVLAGVFSGVFGLSLMWAFRAYAFRLHGTASVHLGAAFFWLTTRGTGRSVWWDFFDGFGLGGGMNWVWGLLGIYAGYHALKGLWLLLPDEDKPDYNILTVAFYPHRLWRRMSDNGESD